MSDTLTTRHDVIAKLGGNPDTGMCRCPAHDDTTASLHVSEKNGKVLVHCHAGCAQDAVLDALGWRRREGRKPSAPSKRNDVKKPSIDEYKRLRKALAILRTAMGAGAYSGPRPAPRSLQPAELVTKYLNGRGIDKVPKNTLALSAREAQTLTGVNYPAMVLPIISPQGQLQGAHVTFLTLEGTNARNSNGKSWRLTYGAIKGGYVQLGRRFHPDKPGIIGEGIESTLSAARISNGLSAVAALNANNMKVITPHPCSEVFIAADNDASGTGEAAANTLAQRLTQAGRVVRIMLPTRPENRENWDLNDELRAVLDTTPPGMDGAGALPGTSLAALRDDMFAIEPFEGADAEALVQALGMKKFMALQFPPRQYLLRPWLTTTGLAMIDALPGHGKTWLALSIGYAVGAGQPLLDWGSERRGRVLYVDGELPGDLLQSRLRLLGAPLPEEYLRILSRSQFEMYGGLMPDLGTPEGRAFLDRVIEENQIDLIILDSVSTLVRSGIDNDVESWRAIQDWSLRHRARGRAIVYLHHHGRSGTPRGTSAREIVLDARLKLTRDEEQTTENETAFRLEYPKAREFFGGDTAPMLAYLSTPEGRVHWRRESVKDVTQERVRELLQQGMKPAAIAKEMAVSRSWISQVMKKLSMLS